ncbi:MAG: GHKL domain-containing protein [Lachnospiraceae bacterium]
MSYNLKKLFMLIIFPILQIFIINNNFHFINTLPTWVILFQITITCITELVLYLMLKKYAQKKYLEKELHDAEYKKKIRSIYEDSIKQQKFRLDVLQTKMIKSISYFLENLSASDNASQIIYIKNCAEMDISLYCRNQVVNAIMTEKALQCRVNNICLLTNINIDHDCFIAPHHLCSIFSNLLDNAIEAVLSLPPEQRIIEIISQCRASYLVIVSKNSFSINYPNRIADPSRGYGTQILQDIATQYHGDYFTELDTNFKASIILQIG